MRVGASRGAVRLARHDGRVSDKERHGEAPPVLRHIDLPLEPGARLRIQHSPSWEGLGFSPISGSPDPQEYTVDLNGERWRAVFRSSSIGPDGAFLELEIEGRYRADIDGMNGRERT